LTREQFHLTARKFSLSEKDIAVGLLRQRRQCLGCLVRSGCSAKGQEHIDEQGQQWRVRQGRR
jgi:hypothetical protein